jgi:Ca2+-binding RTX toxin-like protein
MSGIIPPVEAGPVGVEHHALSAQNEVRATVPAGRERSRLEKNRLYARGDADGVAHGIRRGARRGDAGHAEERQDHGHRPGDVVSARGGTDTVVGRVGNDELYGQPGGDSISGSEGDDDVYGGNGADNLNGGDGIDELSGGNNNDTIDALGGGWDSINCGLGSDDQVIADEVDGVNINDRG